MACFKLIPDRHVSNSMEACIAVGSSHTAAHAMIAILLFSIKAPNANSTATCIPSTDILFIDRDIGFSYVLRKR